jgi:hypothetical protein
MYKRIALLILAGLFVTACDKKVDAPADTVAPAEISAAAESTPVPVESAVEPAEAEAVVESTSVESSDEVGVAECDDYINKYKACMSKMPAEGRDIYQQGLDQMVDSWKQMPAGSRSALAEGCKMSIENSRTAMQAMGCDW